MAKKKDRTPKTTRREMSNIEKGMIIAFFYCFQNIILVAQIFGRPWTTIKAFHVQAWKREALDNLRHPSRTFIRQAKCNRAMIRSDFRDKCAPGISLATGNNQNPKVLVLP